MLSTLLTGDKGKAKEFNTVSDASSSTSGSSTDSESSDSDSDREITAEYLESLLEEARQNALQELPSSTSEQETITFQNDDLECVL
jgi:hypothetical protein